MRDSERTRASREQLPASGRARLAITGICGVLVMLAAACQSFTGTPDSQQGSHARAKTVAAGPARVSISPANGSVSAKPNHGVTVTVAHGNLQNVSVTAGHSSAPGTLSRHGTVWHSLWPLRTGAHYTVTATAVGTGGKTVTATSAFRTLRPAQTFTASTVLGRQVYGVGMPIMISFSQPVTHRSAVEKAIEIKSSKPVVGAWFWDGNQALEFRPRNYWPQHTHVSFTGHFNGVEAARGVYGTANLSQSFTIGRSLIGVTSARTHRTRIYYKNKLYATWTDSSGMPGDDTANGTYLTIEKANPTLMSGPGYHNLPVYWAVRFTWSGDYYHSAPWSLGEQGFVNVSHGCVNLSPAHAQWYYQRAVAGDPITITGSPAAGKWDDGYTPWFLTFNQVLKHSATHLAVEAGPNGSTFVNPASVPAALPTTKLTGSKPHNYLAG